MAEGGEMLQEREIRPPCATGHRQRVRAYGPPGAKSPDGDLGPKGGLESRVWGHQEGLMLSQDSGFRVSAMP